jgi:hypothetical protein
LVEHQLAGPRWSTSTLALLSEQGLTDLAQHHPREAFLALEQATVANEPNPQRLLALAELADRIGRMNLPLSFTDALAWSRDAAVFAVFCLRELGDCQSGSITWCKAQHLHNDALARCLRLARTHVKPRRTNWHASLSGAGILTVSTVADWAALGFDTLHVADEFTVLGPRTACRRAGLGVPLIAHRGLDEVEAGIWKPYGPREAVFAASAVIKPCGSIANWRQEPVELVLHDPVREEVLNMRGCVIPLAADLTPPLVHRLSQNAMLTYEYWGVLDPQFYSTRAGIFALDPYQPGKIPLVLVHGLWSNPAVWITMLDALRGDPVLRSSYQFWVALNPSGYPLPLAAHALRRSLREIRHRFDPQHTDHALDNMVILGKSTGGQTTRMLVQPSGQTLWNVFFTKPIDQIHATPSLKADLADVFFFQPEPYVRRVIFLTTSHRGSELAGHPGIRLGTELIRRNNPLRHIWAELDASNSQSVFQPYFRGRVPGSVDGMEAGSPLLTALDSQQITSEVAYHSIIANIHRNAPLGKMTDGLISYSSAHIGGAASEHIVTAAHTCERDPQVIAEVRRLLLLHLREAKTHLAIGKYHNTDGSEALCHFLADSSAPGRETQRDTRQVRLCCQAARVGYDQVAKMHLYWTLALHASTH